MTNSKKIWLSIIAGLTVLTIGAGIFGLGLVSGYILGGAKGINTSPTSLVASPELLKQMSEVEALIRQRALKVPTKEKINAGVVQGLLLSLDDPYAYYFNADQYKSFMEENSGFIGGIGVVLGQNKDGRAYVVKVFKNTPAEHSGVMAGDIFVSVDGTKQSKWTPEQIVKLVRGNPGTSVTIGFLRVGSIKSIDIRIAREKIIIPNIESKLLGTGGDIGYVRLYQFTQTAVDDVSKSIKNLKAKGAKSFILDLRENPGGLLQSSVGIVSLFVEEGVVVRVEERNKPQLTYDVTGKTITDAKLVVLVDANSASASEIVAGSLQDYKRATIVGEKSFGKGTVQEMRPLSFGGAVKFTIAHYLTSKSRIIDGRGVVPDVEVKMDPKLQDKPTTDTQLQKAIQLLN